MHHLTQQMGRLRPFGDIAILQPAADLSALAGAVSAVSGELTAFSHLQRATQREHPAADLWRAAVFGPAIGRGRAGDVIMVAPVALVSASGNDVQLQTSREAVVHMETAPAQLVDAGTQPPALTDIATPTRSLWQTNSVAMKLRLPTSWLLRHPSALAWTTTTAW